MSTKFLKLSKFAQGYVECALWSENDNSDDSGGEPLDSNYDVDDIADEALKQMQKDCEKFRKANIALLADMGRPDDYCGHDFWLTRNGHGTGFWDRYMDLKDASDRDKAKVAGDKLTEACKKFGECHLYVGDDGKIYLE